ncbi:PEP-CTERM sorting domain-containing protein [Nitrosovibrio sp. Nv6]|uniref:PEP-CTERM sorting domain-containing protein n=1 Tax=Nitrosovibrio sp. Nv6 TaxID=1855340 RepID=UPI0008AC3FFF|nr:PEP-CTERM sorting domain-containing protein [Nitrosovibrio sp. Nv6]SEP36465.1 hypothetical protein SAMN05216316_2621 [Nitrosovibrio sp. Nv6]
MIRIHPWIFYAALAASLSFTSSAQGASINVLWYTYADQASEYRQKISQLSKIVHSLPQTDGLSWNLTYWDAGSAAPDFAAFDVLVIESGEAFLTGSANGPPAVPDYDGILDNRAAIEAARGDRTFITAADADFHAIRGDTGNILDDSRSSKGDGKCAPPFTSTDCWDGAVGHLVNAVNWAGSGNGLGIVSFLDGEHPGSFWWTHENSFLRSDLDGYVDYAGSEQNPVINPLQANHPLNRGLSSTGLSNWSTSFHAFFLPIEGYTPIVDSSQRPGWAVAIATSVAPPLPEPKIYRLRGAGAGCTAYLPFPLLRNP